MLSFKSSIHVDANSDPNSYRTTNFSTSIFHLKFDFDFKDFSDENVRYMLVWIYSSLSELAIYDVKIFEYDKLEST